MSILSTMSSRSSLFMPFPLIVTIFLGIAQPSAAAERLVGGYSKVSITNAQVIAGAEFAVGTLVSRQERPPPITLVEILEAQQQVVAGMNYRLRLKISKGGTVKQMEAVVWRKLSGEHRLTSWAWSKSDLASDLPVIPVKYRDYHFASETNL